MKLKNKVAIVTGGGKGIGEEISLGLAKEGAKVVVADLDKENSSNVVKEIVKNNGDAIYIETDVSNEASVKNLISETINRFDQIDILINNAGIRHVKKLENHDIPVRDVRDQQGRSPHFVRSEPQDSQGHPGVHRQGVY